MAVQLQGNGGVVTEVDGTSFRAVRMTLRPADYGVLGHYAASGFTTTMAAGLAANSEVLQFRWADATRFAVIQEVRVDAMNSLATGFAAGFGQFDLTLARAWTADGSGGAALTLTGNNQKLRTTMGSSQMGVTGSLRVATTAALGAGTKTLDAQRVWFYRFNITTTVNNVFIPPTGSGFPVWLFDATNPHVHPIVLANQEGFVVRATVPATGTWDGYFTVRWAEVTAY